MPTTERIGGLAAQIEMLRPVRPVGRVIRVDAGLIRIAGLASQARIGDQIAIRCPCGTDISGEVVQLSDTEITVLPDRTPEGVSLYDRAFLADPIVIAPSADWLGRIIDASGNTLDGAPLLRGPVARQLYLSPPQAASRQPLGTRLDTGFAVTNTLLPIVSGQRIGVFAGSGVGKSSMLGHLAKHMTADVIVVALVGERGREVRNFVEEIIGPEGMRKAVVVAATSDQSPLLRRRSAWTAMTVAEHFRDQGKSVLLLFDSITRFAEAHREVAVASGEAPVLRGYPPSTSHQIMSLCERAGPGGPDQGNITAVFTVLVAGSDMDEPIADILRGVLDGHIVLSREIAERGRYPAIDVSRSVSRSLPAAATDAENATLCTVRKLLGTYEKNATMIRAGLYAQGADPEIDNAVALWPALDAFIAKADPKGCLHSFQQLELILRRSNQNASAKTPAVRSSAQRPAAPSSQGLRSAGIRA